MGPFTHIIFARRILPELTVREGWPPGEASLRSALEAGALAPDGGYYPGGAPSLARAAHLDRPWEFCRALLDLAASDHERAFALGWLSHALLDLRGHAGLVNPAAGSAFSADPLAHKRVEWGLERWVLSQPENQRLWRLEPQAEPGLALWVRALEKVYGARLDPAIPRQAQAAQIRALKRLPVLWRWVGGLQRPGRSLGNALGRLTGAVLRPILRAWFRPGPANIDQRAILFPRRPRPEDQERWEEVLGLAARELTAILDGGAWPQGGLDAEGRGSQSGS